jgi:hypothetical protein
MLLLESRFRIKIYSFIRMTVYRCVARLSLCALDHFSVPQHFLTSAEGDNAATVGHCKRLLPGGKESDE